MSTPVFFITISLFIGAIVGIFAMKYISAAYQARARLKSETAVAGEVAEIKTRLASVEKILKDVG